jgi:hypothetical protein
MTGTIAAQEAVPAERFTTCMAAFARRIAGERRPRRLPSIT